MIVLLVVAAIVVSAPIGAALLVSVASLHEDAGQSLARRATNLIGRAARRLLGVSARGIMSTQDGNEAARPLTGSRL
jgi:hypothetical protein